MVQKFPPSVPSISIERIDHNQPVILWGFYSFKLLSSEDVFYKSVRPVYRTQEIGLTRYDKKWIWFHEAACRDIRIE